MGAGQAITQVDETFSKELRRIGARFDPVVLRETRSLYRPAVEGLPWAKRPGIYDLAYGPHERHRIDVYPADRSNAPIILFLHGGGFVGGDKRGDEIFYANVGRYFAVHGFLSVLANYRLAPEATWPSGNEDAVAIVEWIRRHGTEYGGDGSRIVLVGQSAGASHIAGYLFDPRVCRHANTEIRAAILMSGFYRAKVPLLEGPRAYVGEDAANWLDRSPAAHVSAGHPPLLLSIAELDPSIIAEQTLDFAMALNTIDGSAPRLSWFEGHNHVSTVHSLGVGQDVVGKALRAFADDHTR